ncbi:MAG TPA: YbhB/YbcL family Raf kinase inhibitor-like protein [Candidatus Angelobacter sp.]
MISQQRAGALSAATLMVLVLATPIIMAPAVRQSKEMNQSMLHLTSTAFRPEENIPAKFTCDDRNISPELSWSGEPAGTKSFALVMHDPDAPIAGGYTHWLVYNIPATSNNIPENAPNQDQLPGGGKQGKNDSGTYGYMGPCPPSGTHRYYFRLYALGVELDPAAGVSKAALEQAMEGHILAKAELLGRYKRSSGKAA